MRYFKIGDTVITTVVSLDISKAPRKRTVSTNLNGDMLIDQQSVKSTITITIALATSAIMAAIENAITSGFVNISYYDGADLVTKSATCSKISKPNPFYINGDKTQGVVFNNVTVEWEER